jgi:hypothetical protein
MKGDGQEKGKKRNGLSAAVKAGIIHSNIISELLEGHNKNLKNDAL